MKPYDLIKIPRHIELAARAIKITFKSGQVIEPDGQRLATLKDTKATVWRLHWEITPELVKAQSHYPGRYLRATENDAKHGRRLVIDVYPNGNIIDYIIEPGQPTVQTGKRRNY